MQKFNDPCIKTGDFARLCGTNKRTLIHYDEIGLFKPAYTDDRGYRYYSESQFDVFFTINCLSKLGMPLREIGAFLNHRNPQALKKLLLEQREEVLKEEDEYLNYLSLGYKVIWDENRIYFPIENGDASIIAENQRVAKIKFRRLSGEYKDGLIYICQEILSNEFNESQIRKTLKNIEKGE